MKFNVGFNEIFLRNFYETFLWNSMKFSCEILIIWNYLQAIFRAISTTYWNFTWNLKWKITWNFKGDIGQHHTDALSMKQTEDPLASKRIVWKSFFSEEIWRLQRMMTASRWRTWAAEQLRWENSFGEISTRKSLQNLKNLHKCRSPIILPVLSTIFRSRWWTRKLCTTWFRSSHIVWHFVLMREISWNFSYFLFPQVAVIEIKSDFIGWLLRFYRGQ